MRGTGRSDRKQRSEEKEALSRRVVRGMENKGSFSVVCSVQDAAMGMSSPNNLPLTPV